MKLKYIVVALLCLLYANLGSAQTATSTSRKLMPDSTATGPIYIIKTNLGDIKVRLYDDTPQHRDNFVKLADSHFYDGVLFHRVIKDFMVQTGDPNTRDTTVNASQYGEGDTGYTVPAEIRYPKHFHKYGALAAARTGDEVNPERASSGSQFYIVTGNVYQPQTIARIEERVTNTQRKAFFQKKVQENMPHIQAMQQAADTVGLETLQKELIAQTEQAVPEVKIPAELVDVYTTIGGTPHLDDQYTVFGEVLDGMDVVELIQNVPTGPGDVPTTPVRVEAVIPVK